MIKASNLMIKINNEIAKESIVPLGLSRPVLRKENNKYYVAFFVFYYTENDLIEGKVNRPARWILTDLKTGKVIQNNICSEKDFSTAPEFSRYSLKHSDKKYNTSRTYYDEAYALFDSVRLDLINNQEFNEEKYNEYIKKILANTPTEYERFTIELSNV